MIPQGLLSPARKLRPAILAASIATAATVAAHAQSSVLYQAPTGTDGKWNLYEYVLDATDFATAQAASSGIINPAAGATPGFLTEIGSAFENAAVSLMTQRTDAWIGLTDRAGVVAGASEGNFVWTNGNPLTRRPEAFAHLSKCRARHGCSRRTESLPHRLWQTSFPTAWGSIESVENPWDHTTG